MQFGILRPFWGVGCIGRKRRSIFGEGKVGKCLEFENIWSPEEKENVWSMKMFCPQRKSKRREIFEERRYLEKGKYLEKAKEGNIW